MRGGVMQIISGRAHPPAKLPNIDQYFLPSPKSHPTVALRRLAGQDAASPP